jgi:hypothetical protein
LQCTVVRMQQSSNKTSFSIMKNVKPCLLLLAVFIMEKNSEITDNVELPFVKWLSFVFPKTTSHQSQKQSQNQNVNNSNKNRYMAIYMIAFKSYTIQNRERKKWKQGQHSVRK